MMDLVAKLKLEVDKSSLKAFGSVPERSPGMDAFKKMEKTPDLIVKAQKEAMKQINADIFKNMVREQKDIISPPKDMVREQKDIISPPKDGGIIGSIMSSGLGKIATPLAGIAGGIGLIVASSKMLQGVLVNIMKAVFQIIRPIGDIIAVGLMPLIAILRPIGVFFNVLMKPYIQKAMTAMRAGEAQIAAGDYGGALASFGTGAEYLLKPFLDIGIKINTELLGAFGDLLMAIPLVGDAARLHGIDLGKGIRDAGLSFIDTTTNILDIQLGTVLADAEASTGRSMSGMVKNIGDAEVSISFLSKSLELGMKSPFTSTDGWIKDDWGPEFTGIIANIFTEANKAGLIGLKEMTDIITKAKGIAEGISEPAIPTGYTQVTRTFEGGGRGFVEASLVPTAALTAAQKYAETFAMPGSQAWIEAGLPYQHGGTIPETGLYTMHEGEKVVPKGATYNQPVSISLNPNYTISTNKSADDIRRIIEDVADSQYRELVSRMGG
jgi:hypothetical protein